MCVWWNLAIFLSCFNKNCKDLFGTQGSTVFTFTMECMHCELFTANHSRKLHAVYAFYCTLVTKHVRFEDVCSVGQNCKIMCLCPTHNSTQKVLQYLGNFVLQCCMNCPESSFVSLVMFLYKHRIQYFPILRKTKDIARQDFTPHCKHGNFFYTDVILFSFVQVS